MPLTMAMYKATSQPDLSSAARSRETYRRPSKKHSMQSNFEPIPEDGLMKANNDKKRMARSSADLYRKNSGK